MSLPFVSVSASGFFPHRSTGKKKSCCTFGPMLCVRYRTSTSAYPGCRSIFSVSSSIVTSVRRLLFEALALPVPGTPVCHAPPLAKSVYVPKKSDAIASSSFFTFGISYHVLAPFGELIISWRLTLHFDGMLTQRDFVGLILARVFL